MVADVSLGPAMRGWIRAGRSYIEPVEVGEVMRAGVEDKLNELEMVVEGHQDEFIRAWDQHFRG